MAFPCGFQEANGSLGAPKGQAGVEPLIVFRNGRETISCWKVTAEELEEIQRTGRIWVRVLGNTTFPLLVTGTKPFVEQTQQP